MGARAAVGVLLSACATLGLVACGSAKSGQTISFKSTAPRSVLAGSTPYEASASSSSQLRVQLHARGACSVSKAGGYVQETHGPLPSPVAVVFDGVGTCTIIASQGGNDSFQRAPQVQQSIKVSANSPNVSDGAREHIASLSAAALLKTLALPAGAEMASSNPSNLLQQAGEQQSYLVELQRFWRAPGPPTMVLAWFEAHTPAGAGPPQIARSFSGGGSTPDEWFLEFSMPDSPARPGYISSERLEVGLAAARGGGTGIRVDALVNWVGSEGQHAVTTAP